MSQVNEWHGDAPALAQVVRLEAPELSSPVEFFIGGRPLGWNQPWTSADGWSSTTRIIELWNSSQLGEFRKVRASGAGGVITLTALQAGEPFSVTTTVGGKTRSNEIQTITLVRATGGTFTLSFNGEATGTIAWNASASTVQTALEGLSSIAPGDVTVTGGAGVWTVSFAGTLALTNVPPLVPNYSGLTGGTCTVNVAAVTQGALPVNEVQILTLPGNPTGGTFTLALNGLVTSNIGWNASASAVQTALRAVLGSSSVSCTGGALPGTAVTITFEGDLGGQDLPLLVPDGTNLTGASVALSLTTAVTGVTGTNAKYKFRLTANPATANHLGQTGYKFRLSTSMGQTRELDWTSTATQVRTAIEEDIFQGYAPGSVTVTGSLADSWVAPYTNQLEIEFVGKWHSTRIILSATKTAGGPATLYQTTINLGLEGTNEQQTLTQTGTPSGTFRLAWGGATSDPIPYGSTAAAIEDILVRMAPFGMAGAYYTRPDGVVVNPFHNFHGSLYSTRATVRVSGGPLGTSPVQLVFGSNGLQSTNVAAIAIDEGAASITASVNGVPGVPEVQTVTLSGAPWGGTFTLTYDGQTTGTIPYNAVASELAAALEGLSNLAEGQVIVSKSGAVWTVSFSSDLGNVPQMTGSGTSLKNGLVTVGTVTEGGLFVTQRTLQRSRGPWHYNDPYNWSLGRIPERDDLLRFQFGSTGPRWGLVQRATFTIDAFSWVWSAADFADGQAVEVKSSGTLPTGLSANTAYYVTSFDADLGRFQLSATRGGAAIELSGGSGTHTVFVPLAGIKTLGTWKGWIGNTVIDREGGFRDYRPNYLRVGFMSGATVTLSEGTGDSSPLVRIDGGDFPLAKCETLDSAAAIETELPAILLLMSHEENSIEVIGGNVGVALLRNETAVMHHLIQRGGEVELGEGVTFAEGGYIDNPRWPLRAQCTLDGKLLIRG